MRKQWLIFLPLAFQARGNGGLTWFNNSERRRHATEDNDVSDTFKGKRVKRAITNKPFSILWTCSEKVISSINAAEQARSLVLDCFSAQALQSYRNIIGLIAEVLFSKAFSSSTMKTVNTRGSERKGDVRPHAKICHTDHSTVCYWLSQEAIVHLVTQKDDPFQKFQSFGSLKSNNDFSMNLLK